jgi:uncharacterized protein (DUF2236 family)
MSATTTATDIKAAQSTSSEPAPAMGKYGPYNRPVLEPSPAMRAIVAENCCMTAGTAAVLLQISARGVGLGVSDHSSFTKKPVQRARRSLFYIYGMAFGSDEERRRLTDATHAAHSRVKGKDYDADDPALQLWVAATMYWSLVLGYEEVYGPLDDDTAEQVYREFSVMATGLRVSKDMWPADRAAFRTYWEKTVAELDITDEAKEVAQFVLYPSARNLPWGLWLYAKLTGPWNRIATAELLPERVRNELGLPSTAFTRNVYWLMNAYNRAVYPLLPTSVRHFAKNYYLKDLRARLARGGRL